ncbi:MAG: choice-of-anchor A family protein [Solirubrobacterales bacterium]
MNSRTRVAVSAALSLILGLFALISFSSTATATTPATECVTNPLGAATGYTEFIQTNGSRGSESEGAIAYGGNLAASGMTVGTHLPANTPTTYPALVVNGTSNSFNLQKGSAYLSGRTGNVNFNGVGSYLTTAPIDFAAAFTDLTAKSASWAATTANGSATVVNTSNANVTGFTGGNNSLYLKGTDTTRNVFSVTAAQLSGLSNILIDVPSGSTALINVSGANVQIDGQMWFRSGGNWNQAQDSATATFNKKMLWNFSTATDVKLQTGSAFAGTVLAPKAHLNSAQVGHNIGQVIAKSFQSNFETHHAPFDGCLPPTTPDGPTGSPKLKITKIADNPVVSDGDQVVFTITVKNEGTADSQNVKVSDLVPVGLTVNSADAPCTVSGQQVECVAGTLAAGQTKTYKIYATAKVLTVDNTNDQLTIGKVEQHVSIQAGQTQTAQITCGADGIMSDGSVRVDSVDQGTGDLNSVEVHKLKSISESTYEATVTNHSTGQAQVKLFGVCLPKKTTGGHELLVSAPVTQTVVLNQGVHTVNLTCGSGYTPIAPGLQVTGGRAYVIASAPNGATGRKVTLRIDQNNTTAEVSIRCLSNKTSAINGASSELQFTTITKSIQVGADQTASEQLTCGENAKGIVAGWEYDEELVQLGNDPQPKTRVFRVWNPTHHPLNATLYLLCLEVRTGTPGGGNEYVNTAGVSSSTAQGSGAVLSDDASVTVEPEASTPPPPPSAPVGPTGNAGTSSISALGASFTGRSLLVKLSKAGKGKLTATSVKKYTVGGKTFRKGSTLGKATFDAGIVKAKVNKLAAKAIKAGKIKRVKITITSNGKKKTGILRLKRS